MARLLGTSVETCEETPGCNVVPYNHVGAPKNLVGAFECRREIQTWREVEELRPFLTPMLDHGMGWILMPQAEQELDTQEINDLLSELGETGWGCDDANEAHNLGKLDGESVIIDYGMGRYHVEGHRAHRDESDTT